MTIITLIHGTWARGAQWTKDTSPLAIALKERIEGDVRIETFRWSGRNLHSSRRRAAVNLRRHVLITARQYPEARHFLIAHSHGGVVALYSLADAEAMGSVSGVICLATPFIVRRARPLPKQTFGLLCGFVAVAVFIFLGNFFREWKWISEPSLLLVIALAVMGVLMLSLRALLAWCVLGRWKADFGDIYNAIDKSFSLARLSSSELLILRAPGDEASAALAASVFASSIVGKLSKTMTALYRVGTWVQGTNERLGAPGRGKAALLTILACVLAVVAAIGFNEVRIMVVIPFLLVLLFCFATPAGDRFDGVELRFVGYVVQMVYLVVTLPLLLLCSLFSVPFGLDTALAATLMELSVEATPVGTFTVLNLEAATAHGLWHSLPHSDAEAFDAIVRWINGWKTQKSIGDAKRSIDFD